MLFKYEKKANYVIVEQGKTKITEVKNLVMLHGGTGGETKVFSLCFQLHVIICNFL